VKGLSPGDWWHGRAGKVRFDITMSLDGFIAGSNDGDASVAVWPFPPECLPLSDAGRRKNESVTVGLCFFLSPPGLAPRT
jgi:hypothetical protein